MLYSGTWAGSLPKLADAVRHRDLSFLRRAAGAQDSDSPLPSFRIVDPSMLAGQLESQLVLPVDIAYRCTEHVPPPVGFPNAADTNTERLLRTLTCDRRPA